IQRQEPNLPSTDQRSTAEHEEVTVFSGSSAADASHARRLWSSASLPPPLELRPAAADVRQRLPVSRPRRSGPAAAPGAAERPQSAAAVRRRQEERRRYEEAAVRRSQILDLLRRQRERRMQKEVQVWRERRSSPREEEEEEEELVRQLQ
uniref:Cilia- and flagella-associated protein HOATZ n=1 Tax=Oryzias melastigma TaxID=30732 RepID=A0A3B3C473_ORYME